MRFFKDETFLLLGGGGMVGRQVAYEIARELGPRRIIICALTQGEADDAVEYVSRDYPNVNVRGVAGNVFVRHEWNPSSGQEAVRPGQLTETAERRRALYEDTFGEVGAAYERSELVWLIKEFSPDVIIDSINTATAISYQDVYAATDLARERLGDLRAALAGGPPADDGLAESATRAFEEVLVSQSVPQLVRHVLLINKAMREENTRLYLKIGTTGTGGMGLNVPYTHSEDKPSATLLEKTAIAFAHTGLMFLMARTLGGPAVKEFKPAAMIGYSDLRYDSIRIKPKGRVGVPGERLKVYASRTEPLGESGSLRLRPAAGSGAADGYEPLGELNMVLVNTGENGLFTMGEFQAITFMRQMEFITPEEIARQVVLEVKGSNTGYDVIAAVDGASMNPTYRAGYIRQYTIEQLLKMEEEERARAGDGKGYSPSVALGELGPPELGKLLWEAHLFRAGYGTLKSVLAKTPEELATELTALVEREQWLRDTIVSVGLPILTPDGRLVRGPYIRIPEEKNRDHVEVRGPGDVDAWAAKGWVDLRPSNMRRWRERFETMGHGAERIRERGSAAFTRDAYLSENIQIGAVVGWIFNNEEDFGYRIK
ncbi:MAG: hypothetical protein LC795_13225 [Acidobacteria bacterium]|nr:hypothetical protein [Acidobacteriota bacterium]